MSNSFELAESVMTCIILNSIVLCFLSNFRTEARNKIISALFLTMTTAISVCITTLAAFATFRAGSQDIYLYAALIAGIAYLAFTLRGWIMADISKKGLFLFAVCLCAILYITLFFRIGMHVDYIKLDLLYAAKRLFYEDSIAEARHLFLNTILFVPLGFSLPLIDSKNLSRGKFFTYGVLLSACIESIQLIFAKGECDVADIFGNGLGMFLGIMFCKLALTIRQRHPKKGEKE